MQTVLETNRLLMRRFTEADVDNLYMLESDPRVMRFLTGEPTPRAKIEHEVIPAILSDYERGPAGCWATIERSSGQFVGWLALQPPKDGNVTEVELGYRLTASVWGRGYATEGARALIREAFSNLSVQRIWAQTMAVNTASRRVMEKAGLIHVRTFHPHFEDPLPGTEHGEVEYELRRPNWSDHRPPKPVPATTPCI